MSVKAPEAPSLEWDEWFTEKMTIDHLLLLEDHLLDYGTRSADDQCLNCMIWHCEKLQAYANYEAPKFFSGAHVQTYQEVSKFAGELQSILVNGKLAQADALKRAREARELRYKLIGYGTYDFAEADMEETGIGIGGRARKGHPRTEAERAAEHVRLHPGEPLPPRGTGIDNSEHPYARPWPKSITVYPDTIEKHYVDKDAFHPGSIRVVKPLPGVLVYLGCKKDAWWDVRAARCYPNPTVHLTIVPRTAEYMAEVEEWEQAGVPLEYKNGHARAVENGELLEVIQAIEEAGPDLSGPRVAGEAKGGSPSPF